MVSPQIHDHLRGHRLHRAHHCGLLVSDARDDIAERGLERRDAVDHRLLRGRN